MGNKHMGHGIDSQIHGCGVWNKDFRSMVKENYVTLYINLLGMINRLWTFTVNSCGASSENLRGKEMISGLWDKSAEDSKHFWNTA